MGILTEVQRSILVVETHAVLASSLAIALRHSGFARTASIHPDELDLAGEQRPHGLLAGDIVLLGLVYGDGRTALPLIQPLVQRGCRVVVMTVDQGLPLVGECLRRGVEAVVGNDMPFAGLVTSLRRLERGDPLMTEDERRALMDSVDNDESADDALARPFSALTDREAGVLAALVEGRSPKQIAHGERISVSTVRGHIQRVLMKLQVNSQREALAMARHAGWPAPIQGLGPRRAPHAQL